MRYACCLLALVLAVFSPSAFAKGACYAPTQMEAEQWLRLHSELMVITLTCGQGSGGQDLPTAYGRFTQNNIGVLHNAEQTMIAWYKKTGKGNPVARLDHLRTRLGNEFGQKVADMTAPNFCAAYRDKVWQLASAPVDEVDQQVRVMDTAGVSYVPLCREGRSVVARKGG
ncbi:MAG: hypothetical protein P4M13_01030 [Alphaproteobacteria bacterium]|nr:hypothetical protein [Alphaproteobacteria bacterium]